MKSSFSHIFVLFLLSFVFLECATSSAGIATSNVPIVDQKYTVISPVEKSTYWITFDFGILGFPLRKPPVDELVKEALAENEADALINIRHWNDKIVILFITVNRMGISAEAVRLEPLSSTQPLPPRRR